MNSVTASTNAADPCKCFDDQSVPSTAAGVAIRSPALNGTFSGAPCALNCTTTVTFTGPLANGLPAGAQVRNLKKKTLLNIFLTFRFCLQRARV